MMPSYKYKQYFDNYQGENCSGESMPDEIKEQFCIGIKCVFNKQYKSKCVAFCIMIIVTVIMLIIQGINEFINGMYTDIPIMVMVLIVCCIGIASIRGYMHTPDKFIKKIKDNDFTYTVGTVSYNLGYIDRHADIIMIVAGVPVTPVDNIEEAFIGQERYVVFITSPDDTLRVPITYSLAI